MHTKIFIIGASGYLGQTLYKALHPYYDVHGTYCSQDDQYADNHIFYPYNASKDDLTALLQEVAPTHIVWCCRIPQAVQQNVYNTLVTYVRTAKCHVLYLSSAAVFDGKREFPAYENTKPYAVSTAGTQLLYTETALQKLPAHQYTIVRVPIVLGANAPLIKYLKDTSYYKSTFEIFPNLVVNVTSDWCLSRQIHYLINHTICGVVHLGSTDLIHHSDLFAMLVDKLAIDTPIFTQVFDSTNDVFSALLSRRMLFPKEYETTVEHVVNEVTLHQLSNPLNLHL